MIQRDLTILLQPSTYILLELHIILISLIIYKPSNFDNLPSDLQHAIGSWHIIVLFVPVCNSLLHPFTASLACARLIFPFAPFSIYCDFFYYTYHVACQCWNLHPLAAIVADGSEGPCLFAIYLIVSSCRFEFCFFPLMSIVVASQSVRS